MQSHHYAAATSRKLLIFSYNPVQTIRVQALLRAVEIKNIYLQFSNELSIYQKKMGMLTPT